jgi:two-component system chemotaxis sensor kinase CheA
MSTEDDELMREFLLESRENLHQLDRDFVALEQDPRDRARLAGIFRCVHTIKGTAGFFGLTKLESLTHIGESQLSRLRDGELLLDSHITSTLLAMVDGVRQILSNIEATGAEGREDFSAIIEALSRIGTPRIGTQEQAPASSSQATPAAASSTQQPASTAVAVAPAIAPAPFATPTAATPSTEAATDSAGKATTTAADTAIRVDVSLLDRVMNLVGELVLARNQILQYGTTTKDAGFINASQRLNLLTTELQAGVMKTRMQPIGNVWNRFPRIVRDLANVCGKKVTLDLDGTETELDRSIIEAIKDPLTHAVRNAVDHGVESPERRVAAGKPAMGRVLLRAYHEGGQVNIEVSDDGGGLSLDKIRARAVERGLVTAERAARMNEREVAHLIFLPGFSTAEQVTNVSGRGVGMDVVKTNIEKIGGTVDISSRPGQGTVLKIKIPLTLAIIPALIVTSGGERFAIPQVNLLELVRLEGAQARRGIESLHGATVYRLRGNLLPLVFLNGALDLTAQTASEEVCNIVVLQADDRQFGLVVDGISDTEEIVVKPLGKELKGISAFAGATIMGDGKVALILDVLGIAQRANVVSPSRERALIDKTQKQTSEQDAREALLLFRVGSSTRMAIPLSMVARLEEIPPEKVERAAGREVVQYRGAILPLLGLSRELLREQRQDTGEPLLVIVYSVQGRSIGFVVDQILDIVEEAITVRSQASREGVLGSAVVQGRVTDLLDVHGVIRRFDATFFDRKEAAA